MKKIGIAVIILDVKPTAEFNDCTTAAENLASAHNCDVMFRHNSMTHRLLFKENVWINSDMLKVEV